MSARTGSGRGGFAHRERGAALLLSFLVVLLLAGVMADLAIRGSVEADIAARELEAMQQEYAARGALEVAKAILVQDTVMRVRAAPLAEAPALQLPALAAFGNPDLNTVPAATAIPDKPHAADQRLDTLLDDWARDHILTFGDVEVRLSIVDEDRKLNVLALLSDARIRGPSRAAMVRTIDLMRAGSAHDISEAQAERIVDGMEAYMRGEERWGMPIPRQTTGSQKRKELAWRESRFQDEVGTHRVFPHTLEEFLAVPGVTEHLLYAQQEAGARLPGLSDVLTVYTSLLLDTDGVLREPEPFVWPFQKQQASWQAREKQRQAARQALMQERADGARGLVNLYTAPTAVLLGLLDAPDAGMFVDAWVRHRVDASVMRAAPVRAAAGALKAMESSCRVGTQVTPADERVFESLVTVDSSVFTVSASAVVVRSGSRSPSRFFRAIVWRRRSADGLRCTVITPLAENPRRE